MHKCQHRSRSPQASKARNCLHHNRSALSQTKCVSLSIIHHYKKCQPPTPSTTIVQHISKRHNSSANSKHHNSSANSKHHNTSANSKHDRKSKLKAITTRSVSPVASTTMNVSTTASTTRSVAPTASTTRGVRPKANTPRNFRTTAEP